MACVRVFEHTWRVCVCLSTHGVCACVRAHMACVRVFEHTWRVCVCVPAHIVHVCVLDHASTASSQRTHIFTDVHVLVYIHVHTYIPSQVRWLWCWQPHRHEGVCQELAGLDGPLHHDCPGVVDEQATGSVEHDGGRHGSHHRCATRQSVFGGFMDVGMSSAPPTGSKHGGKT